MTLRYPGVALAAAILVLAGRTDAAVFCAKQRPDGTFSTGVKIREVCRPNEVTLTPDAVGFCCTASTTTTTTSQPCPTTTTLGAPDCGGDPAFFCGGQCPDSQTCGDDGNGHCACLGPLHCGGAGNFCGGDCPVGQSCELLPVPPGCQNIGCGCQ
jgi:hypothetical protein